MKICTADKMRMIDSSASEIVGIPSIVLMENAALACVSQIEKLKVKKIGIFCGKGNNGGDGFAIARQLSIKGYDVSVFLVCGEDFRNDALINYDIIKNMGVPISHITYAHDLEYYISTCDLIVDAIFGTGITGAVTGDALDIIRAINTNAKKVLSVDIPSGVSADDGYVGSEAIKADITVTFVAYKNGMFLYPGADYTGKIILCDISIPDYIIKNANINVNTIDKELASSLLPKRKNNSQKGDYGKVFMVGASTGMTGAISLASNSALKCGAGLVTAGVPEELNSIMEIKLTEAMTLPLDSENGSLTFSGYNKIYNKMLSSDVLLFGPGMGRETDGELLLREILSNSDIPIVIDADGLYHLSQTIGSLDLCNSNLVFTPHEMEFARLIDKPIEEVIKNRLSLSLEFATRHGVTLVLKGHHTIVTAPDGTQYINTTGNPGMATGGSGDVLSGMIAAFIAGGMDETDAAILSVYLHGLAGDIAAEKLGKISITASDISDNIYEAISNISTGK